MGHYGDHYEADAKRRRERTLEEARENAKRHHVPLMADTEFRPIGVCQECARTVKAVPNWGCQQPGCPHRP